MKEDILKSIRESQKQIHREMLSNMNYENKEFEKEAVALMRDMFDLIEIKTEEWDDKNPWPRGLDGGFNAKKITAEYFERFRELKKKYGIEDKHQ